MQRAERREKREKREKRRREKRRGEKREKRRGERREKYYTNLGATMEMLTPSDGGVDGLGEESGERGEGMRRIDFTLIIEPARLSREYPYVRKEEKGKGEEKRKCEIEERE